MKPTVLLVAIGLALAAAGCFGDDDNAATGRDQLKLVENTAVTGGSRRERRLLQRTVGGMKTISLTRITIGPVQGRRKTDSGAAVPLSFTPVPGPSVRRKWDEWIVAGAFSRRLAAAGLPAEVDGADRQGGFTARPKLKGQPDPKPLSRGQEAALVKAIRSAAKASGEEIAMLEVHRPYGAAVAVSIASDDPASLLKNKLRGLLAKVDVLRKRAEGVYLAVLDQDRRLALEWASWTRNPAGSYWVRRDLADCSPISQSEPPGTEPPPSCPV